MGLKVLQQNLHHRRKYHQQWLKRAGAVPLLPPALHNFSPLSPHLGNCACLYTNRLGLNTRSDMPEAAFMDSMDFVVSRSIGIARLCRILLTAVSNKADGRKYAVHDTLEKHTR